MKIFISYASQDRGQVEPIRQALAAQGHDIFFDREDLPPGEAFDARIRQAIERCDLFVCIVSPNTLDPGSYTLNEVDIAQKVWANPSGRVLPVLLQPVDFERIPPYLKTVTLLETEGNVPAAVADAVHRLSIARRRRTLGKAASIAVVFIVAALAFWALRHGDDSSVTGKDGAPAILIPAGKSTMGDGEQAPLREVYVDAFYLDKLEVTASRYARFLQATGSLQPPDYWDEVKLERDGELPVIGVTWYDADAYCRWAGKRMPSEAEWERSARSADRRMFPWGNGDPTSQRATFGKSATAPYQGGLTAVGRHEAGSSPFGVQDLAGNASEWVADWFADSFSRNDVRNPKGPDSGTDKVIRGGGWYDPADRLQSSRRFHAQPDQRSDDIGFRCARDAS